jgi:hypothetical protein
VNPSTHPSIVTLSSRGIGIGASVNTLRIVMAADAQTQRATGKTKDHALGEQLSDQPRAADTERRSNGYLTRSAG